MSDLPKFNYNQWQEGWYTAKQLSAKGYKPGNPVALIRYSKAADGSGYLKVYRLDDAIPKPPLSEARQAALAKMQAARIAKLTCSKCQTVVSSKRGLSGGLCDYCYHDEKLAYDRSAAGEWARGILASGAVILDTETTGLHASAELVQIAVIDMQGQTLLNSLCKPVQYSEPNEATGIHGITPEMVADAPTFDTLFPALYPLLHEREVVIYNVAFDKRVLSHCRDLYSLPKFEAKKWHCAMEWFAQWCGDWSEWHQDYRWQPLPSGDHTALGDCLATLGLLKAMERS